MIIKKQIVRDGGHVENIGIQNNYPNEHVSFQKYISSVLFIPEQSKKGRYYYRSELTPFFGRTREKDKLKDFLLLPEKLSILTVTGYGGSGKSRLVYEFVKETRDWDRAYLDWKDFGFHAKNHLIISFDYPKDLMIVLDYVLGYADEIGDFLYKMKLHCNTLKNKIRVIIIERESHNTSSDVYWFSKIVKKHRLDDFLYCTIDLCPLKFKDLKKIVASLVEKKTGLGISSDKEISKNFIEALQRIDPGKQRPLFLLYIIDAWLEHKDALEWNREEFLKWVYNNEIRRVYELAKYNADIMESFLNLLCYATMVSGIKEEEVCDCLKTDYEKIKEYAKKIQTNIVNLFNEINSENHTYIYLEPMFPDLMGEFFCLNFLTEYKLKNGDEAFVLNLVQSALENHENEYASFIVRLSQDYEYYEDYHFGQLEGLFYGTCWKVKCGQYEQFLYQLIMNISDARFQVMFKRIFDENKAERGVVYKLAKAENLVYLAVFPFEFPGIDNDKELYIQELGEMKEQNVKFWFHYVKAVSQLIESNKDKNKKWKYVDEIRKYIYEYIDEDTAYVFGNLLQYLVKSEKSEELYREMQDLVASYIYSEEIVLSFMEFMKKEVSKYRTYSFFAKESIPLIAMIMVKYHQVKSVRENCFGMIKWIYRNEESSDLLKKYCKDFDEVLQKNIQNVPELANVYCVILGKMANLSEYPAQKTYYIRKLINILAKYQCDYYSDNFSGLYIFQKSLSIEFPILLEKKEVGKVLAYEILGEIQQKKTLNTIEIIPILSSKYICSSFNQNKKDWEWQVSFQKELYKINPNQEVFGNYVKAYMSCCNFYSLEDREKRINILLEEVRDKNISIDENLLQLIYYGLMEPYLSGERGLNIVNAKVLLTGKLSLEHIFLDCLQNIPDKRMEKFFNKLLKYHYSPDFLSIYQKRLFQNFEEWRWGRKDLLPVVQRFSEKYGKDGIVKLQVKILDGIVRAAKYGKERIRFLIKIKQLVETQKDTELFYIYQKAFEFVIINENGKRRKRLLLQYYKEIGRIQVFAEISYMDLCIKLAKKYTGFSQKRYLGEVLKIIIRLDTTKINLKSIVKVEDIFWIFENFDNKELRDILFQSMFCKSSVEIVHFCMIVEECIINEKLFVEKKVRIAIVHSMSRLISEINENILLNNLDVHIKLIDSLEDEDGVWDVIVALVEAIDICREKKVRRKYYNHLMSFSENKPIDIFINMTGKLVVKYQNKKIVSCKKIKKTKFCILLKKCKMLIRKLF